MAAAVHLTAAACRPARQTHLCKAARRCWHWDYTVMISCSLSPECPACCSAESNLLIVGQHRQGRKAAAVCQGPSLQNTCCLHNLCALLQGATGCVGAATGSTAAPASNTTSPQCRMASSKNDAGLILLPLSSRTTSCMITQQRHTEHTLCAHQHCTVGLLTFGRAQRV